MSAVGLEEMSRQELCEYCFKVHGHKPEKKTKSNILIKLIKTLDDTLENPLQVGEEVRYMDEEGICTINVVAEDSFSIIDENGDEYDEVSRFELTRVTTPLPLEKKLEPVTEVEVEVEVKDTIDSIMNPQYPHEVNEHSYRPKPGVIIIGNLPDDGSTNMRKTGVTHVLNDKVEA